VRVSGGRTGTNFFRAAGFKEPAGGGVAGADDGAVVEESLRALARRKPLVVCGWQKQLQVMISSRIPRVLVGVLARKSLEKVAGRRRWRAAGEEPGGGAGAGRRCTRSRGRGVVLFCCRFGRGFWVSVSATSGAGLV